jgi:hypothetical protein
VSSLIRERVTQAENEAEIRFEIIEFELMSYLVSSKYDSFQ